jgi:branched-chain amino acid transport system ATP-binding protein
VTEPRLVLEGVRAGYGQGDVLHGIDLAVDAGEVLAVLGPNGAGKSTLLKVVAGLVRPSAGRVRLSGTDVLGAPPSELARCGLYWLPEGRAVFPSLTVAENLRLASARPERGADGHDGAYAAFPRLAERRDQAAGTLSGGEQRMLALARAFLAEPLVLLLDEPSLGLAPKVVDEVFAGIARFRDEGTAVVLVEQYVHRSLALADRALVLDRGTVAFAGATADLDADEVGERYLGAAKPVSRRSRWAAGGAPRPSTK